MADKSDNSTENNKTNNTSQTHDANSNDNNNNGNNSNDSNTNTSQSSSENGGGESSSPLDKKDYDIMDPEAKVGGGESKNIQDMINGAKENADKAKNATQIIRKIPAPILIIMLILIIIIGVVGYFTSLPGLMIEKIKTIAKNAINTAQSWFTTESNAYVDDEDVVDLANYLEEMEYDLVGYGFVDVDLDYMSSELSGYYTYTEVRELGYTYYETREENGDTSPRYYNEDGQAYGEGEGETGYYYNSLGILIDNSTGEIAEILSVNEEDLDGDEEVKTTAIYLDKYGIGRSTTEYANSGKGLIYSMENVDTTLLRTYLLSDYRINTLRNDDDSILNTIWSNIKAVFGGYDAAWSKGLIKLYLAENGRATGVYDSSFFNTVEIDAASATLTIKAGLFNNSMEYQIDGWADRYGMSLEFLLSLHLATMAPDLVYAMLQSFDTEVQVYLNDSGEAEVSSMYVEISDEEATIDSGITLSDIVNTLADGGYSIGTNLANSINKTNAQYILRNTGLESPAGCIGEAIDYVILDSTYSDSDDIQTYGIDEETDSEIYSEFENENITVVDNGKEFTIENVSQSIGTDDVYYEDDTYTLLTESAESYGYDEDEAEVENIVVDIFESIKLETMRTTDSGTDDSGRDVSYIYWNVSFYAVKKVKQVRTWTSEVDGEEVEFEWTTYKYIICENGTGIVELTQYDGETIETEITERSDDSYELDYYDEDYDNVKDTWCDTVMIEFIIRDKTIAELVEAGLLVYDENTEEYVAVDSSETRCSDENRYSCCKICKDYVKKVIKALSDLSDSNYQTSTPYIARVLGSWFRDTYFVIPEKIVEVTYNADDSETWHDLSTGDYAIYDYLNETTRSEAEEAMINNAWGNSILVTVDEEYLSDTGEYWTDYITDENGDYVLFYMKPDGTYVSTTENDYGYVTMDEFLSENGYDSQDDAEDDGHVFVKKAVTTTAETVALSSSETIEGIVWSAYGFDDSGSSSGWVYIGRDDDDTSTNDYIMDVYDMFDDDTWENEAGGFYYKLDQTYSITQVEDAQRSETNSTVKWLFKYRKYYIYDGTEDKALDIAEDKEIVLDCLMDYLKNTLGYNASEVARLLGNYGRSALRQAYSSSTITFDWEDIIEEWLEWQLDMYYSGITNDCPDEYIILTDEIGFIEETDDDGNVIGLTVTTDLTQADRIGDPRDPNLINTINIDKTSLDAFSILENTQTLAAEYAYRDFKELVVELDYFDKEDLSDAISEVFSWVIPDISEIGWPVRPYDKQDVDYGALIESAATYEFLSEIGYDVTGDTDEDSDEDSTTDGTTSDDATATDGMTGDTDDDTTDSSTDEDETDESSSSSTSFKGYQGDEYVSSPITGRVVELGTHTRTNVYTEEEETVGYIVIEAIDSDQTFGTTNSSGEVTESYITNYLGENEDALSGTNEMAEALNLFYDEYEDTCDGYTIMIDGINIEGATETITDSSEIWSILSELQDEEGNFGSYEQNEVAALYNSDEQTSREQEEQNKDDAPYLVMVDGDVYIKEGKYIGKTYADDEAATFTTEDEEGNEVTGPANYMRIILKDTDYTAIDDVEDYFDIPEPEVSGSSSGTIYDGDTVEEMVWNALISAGYSEYAAAGAMGNIYVESGFATNNLQNSYESSLGYTDEEYTTAVDNGSYSKNSFVNDSAGYGLCQWTSSGRKLSLYEAAQLANASISDATVQINLLLTELADSSSWSSSYQSQFIQATNVEDATDAFCYGFERPGSPNISTRREAAQRYYETYAN